MTENNHDALAAEVQRIAAWVVQNLDGVHGTLDYSVESLDVVEALASDAAEVASQMPDEQVDVMAQQFGCYVLEVARQNWGGRYQWYSDREQPVLVVGEPAFRVAMMTWDKCKGRLQGDEADNIPFFYQGFNEAVRGARPGVDQLYV